MCLYLITLVMAIDEGDSRRTEAVYTVNTVHIYVWLYIAGLCMLRYATIAL